MPKYEYYYHEGIGGNDIYHYLRKAQTFTPSIAHKITKVVVKIKTTETPDPLVAQIRNVDGAGKPGTTVYASGEIPYTEVPTTFGWVDIGLGNGCNLQADTQYAIVLLQKDLGGSSSNDYQWNYEMGTATYPGGQCWISANQEEENWQAGSENWDYNFEEWGTETLIAYKSVKHKPVGEELNSVEWEGGELHELPTDTILLTSNPPMGGHKIYNIWRTPEGNIKYEFEDVAET